MIRILPFLLFLAQLAIAQQELTPLTNFCDSLVQSGLEQKLVPGLGLVIIRGNGILSKTYGKARVEQQIPIDSTTLFQLGSVGKLFTAIAVLQQVDAGKLDLHTDVNQYVEGFATAPPGRPITLFDLLTHTAGLDDRFFRYLVRSEKDLKSLGEHLREFLPPSFQAPGIEINYSNYSYAFAGHIVERATGVEFRNYVAKNIFTPLGMTRTTYSLPDNYQTLPHYARGYRIRDTYEEVVSYPRHAIPAGGALSCVADMKYLLQELLNPTGKILSDSSMAKLMNRQFTNHDLLMGYTLGMEEQHINGYRGVGKGGAYTGFLSELVVFPEQQFGLLLMTNTQTDNFLELFRNELFNRFLPRQDSMKLREIKLDLREFEGTYRSERYNHQTVEDLLALYQGKFDLHLSKDGDLASFHNGAWHQYRPVDSLVFQNQKIPEEYLVFVRNPSGAISRLYRNVNLAGFYVPVSLSPVTWYDDPVFINEYYFIVVVFIWTFLFVFLFRGWVLARRRTRPLYWSKGLVPVAYLYPMLAVLILLTVQFFGGFMYLARNVQEFYFGIPNTFRMVQLTTWALPVMLLFLVLAAFRLWNDRQGRFLFRVYYSLVTIACLIHFAFLCRWHFFGVNV